MHVLRITRESWVVFGGHWRITRRDRDAGRTPGLHERAGFQRRAGRRRGCAGRHPRARRFPVERAPPACALATAAGCPGRAPWRGGTGGAPEAVRAGQLSKSVAKAPRGGIVREKKRGISTILLRLSGAMGAFATDLDKRRRRGPREGRPDRPGGPTGASAAVAIGPRRRPARRLWAPPGAETCTSHSKVQFQPSFSSAKRTFRVQNAHFECKMHISSAKCTSRRGSGPTPSRQPRTATARTDPRRPRPADHDSRRESRSPGPSEPTRTAGRTGSSALPRTGVLRVP